jgi:hypothetical protein
MIEDEGGVSESANLSLKLMMSSKTKQVASHERRMPEVLLRYSPKFAPYP